MDMVLDNTQLQDIKNHKKNIFKEHLAGYTDIEDIIRFSLRLPVSMNEALAMLSQQEDMPKQQFILRELRKCILQYRLRDATK